jgi:hypothetical protein
MTIRINIGNTGRETSVAEVCECEENIVYIDTSTGSETTDDVVNDVTGETYTPLGWSESLTLTEFTTNVAAPLAYINPEDGSTVTNVVRENLDVIASSVADKSNSYDFNDATLVYYERQDSKNILCFETNSSLWSPTLGDALAGVGLSAPHYIAVVLDLTALPSSTQTIFCLGSSTASVFRTLDITSDGYVQATWKDDSAVTGTVTGTHAIVPNRKTLIMAQHDGDRYRLWIHDGVTHLAVKTATGASGTGNAFTFTDAVIGAKLDTNVVTQNFIGCVAGVMVGNSVIADGYNLLQNLCEVWDIQFNTPSLLNMATDLVAHIPFAGPAGDHVDVTTGQVFTATSTLSTTGVFTNAVNFDGTSRTLQGSGEHAAYDLTNKTQSFIAIRFKPNALGSAYILASLQSDDGLAWSVGVTSSNLFEAIFSTNAARSAQDDDRFTTPVVNAAWNYLFLYTYNGTKWRLLLNTYQDSDFNHIDRTTTTWSALGETNLKLSIGSDFAGSNNANAAIDEVTIWDRVLTETERATWINNGSFRQYPYTYQTAEDGPVVVDPPPTTSTTEYYWGPQFGGGTGPANWPIKSGDYYITFTTPPSSVLGGSTDTLDHFSLWWKTAPNYASNDTSWEYRVELWTDSAGVPGSMVTNGRIDSVVITANFSDPGSASSWQDQFKKMSWTTPPTINASTKYHLKLINRNSNPNTHWTSINGMFWWPPGGYNNFFAYGCPTRTLDDWSLYNDGSYAQSAPMGTLWFTSGTRFGCNYLDTWVARGDFGSGSSARRIGAGKKVRQRLTPHEDITLKRVFISGARRAGTGDITASIVNSSGTGLASATISASNFPLGATAQRRGVNYYTHHWGSAALNTEVTLTGGQIYYLEFSAPNSSEYFIGVLHDATFLASPGKFPGDGFGRYGSFYGSDAYAEYSDNNGATWNQYNIERLETGKVAKYDLAFYTVAAGTGTPATGGGSGSLLWTPSELSGTTVVFDVTDTSNRTVSGSEITQLVDTVGGVITADRPTPVDATNGGPQLASGTVDYAHFDPGVRSRARLDISTSVTAQTVVFVLRHVPYTSSFISLISTSGGGTFDGEVMIFETSTSTGEANTASLDATGGSTTGQVRINGGAWSSTATNPSFAGGAYLPENAITMLTVKMATGTSTVNVLGPRDGFNTLEFELIAVVMNSTAQSDAEIEKIEGWAYHTFGGSNIASGHTYEFNPPTI